MIVYCVYCDCLLMIVYRLFLPVYYCYYSGLTVLNKDFIHIHSEQRLMTLTVKLYLHKSYLGRYVHNFSGLPLVVLLMLQCKILGRVGSYLPVNIL